MDASTHKVVTIEEGTDGSFAVVSGKEHMEMVEMMTQRDRTTLWVPAINQHGDAITLIVSPAFLKADIAKLLRPRE